LTTRITPVERNEGCIGPWAVRSDRSFDGWEVNMIMSAGVRKFALTSHITTSVGWLGSVAAFLALAIAGLASPESDIVRAAYVGMHLTTWYVIVPLCFASLLTGVVEGVGTPWGLFRHYWVVTKLLLTVLATVILLVHTQPIDRVAGVARQSVLASHDLRQLRIQLVGDASAALFVLLTTTILSVYKPWGLTPYGIRRQFEDTNGRALVSSRRARPAGRYVLIAIGAFVAVIVLLHLFGIGLHAH
jgi:hypothetical protein